MLIPHANMLASKRQNILRMKNVLFAFEIFFLKRGLQLGRGYLLEGLSESKLLSWSAPRVGRCMSWACPLAPSCGAFLCIFRSKRSGPTRRGNTRRTWQFSRTEIENTFDISDIAHKAKSMPFTPAFHFHIFPLAHLASQKCNTTYESDCQHSFISTKDYPIFFNEQKRRLQNNEYIPKIFWSP